MNENKIRQILIYKNYFIDFLNNQKQKVKDKIFWTFKVIETIEKITVEYFKHIENT